MKKGNLIINVVLIIAIAVLYVLHFTGSEKEVKIDEKPEKQTQAKSDLSTDLPIAYVNIDTLLNNMQMYEDLTENLTTKQQRLENNFASDYRSFEREIVDFQDKVQKGLLTRREAADIETQLSNRRLELENRRNDYLMELQEENLVSQNKVIDYIMKYLEEYNSDGTYRFIFSYSFGGGLLYASDALDITYDVLDGINNKYEAEEAAK
ncbi:MAG: OmpH family outer membrane protein [Bacteroidales bacterium]